MTKFTKIRNISPWRKLSLSFWERPRDPSVYGWYDFDVSQALKYLDNINQTAPVKVTLTHYFAKALGLTIAQYPMINGIIRWGGIYIRDSVDLFLQVAIKESAHKGDHLSGAKIKNIDKKSLTEIAQELGKTSGEIRQDQDPQFQKQFELTKWIPQFLLKPLVKFNAFLVYNLRLAFPKLGLVDDPFGSAMLTSVGSLDAPPGLAPLVPMSRCPFVVCIGRVENKPWVVDSEKLEVRPVMRFTITFDHRFMDGLTASKMFKSFIDILYHPETHFEP